MVMQTLPVQGHTGLCEEHQQGLHEDLPSPSGKVGEESSGHRFLQKFHDNTLFSLLSLIPVLCSRFSEPFL